MIPRTALISSLLVAFMVLTSLTQDVDDESKEKKERDQHGKRWNKSVSIAVVIHSDVLAVDLDFFHKNTSSPCDRQEDVI